MFVLLFGRIKKPATVTTPVSGFDYYRRGEPLVTLSGPTPNGFDYYRRTEPLQGQR